ncbi:MAG: AAA family ATPase [Chitinophagaceae bacterium]|nr:AAA family ATPase [Chitinophagaceae bacterium]
MYNRRTKEFGNGRDVRSFFEKTLEKRAARMTASADAERDFIIIADDIEDTNVDISNDKIEQLLAELDSLTGLHAVKLQMRSLVNFVRMEQRRAAEGGKNSELTLHCIFKGRPGTGKTTVGRILSNIYHGLGLLPKNHLVEVDRTKLVGEYIGQTAIKTSEKIDEAMGGVLFVDEAYTLAGSAGSSNDYGKEAIETLLKRMEDDRGNFIVIAAGYADDMDKFIKTNEGLASRFPTEITFDDYTGSELTSIFLGMLANKNMRVSDETKEKLAEFFDEVYERRDNKFANGRTVRNILEAALKAQSNRLLAIEAAGGDITGMLNTLEFADVSTEKKEDEKPTIDQILEELDQLTGLQKVKEEVRSLISYLQLEDIRRKSGGVTSPLSLHFIFKGRPGTGKTTVGRLLAKIFQQMGLLSKGHLVEVDRGKLVGEHIGATAIRTTERIDAAMGGILLVDEAYSLAPPNSPNDFGREAIDTLLKRMEDDRGKFIVIAAGYEGDMNRFIDSNEGLASRFTQEIHFDDYNGPEMLSIFKGLVARKGLMINSETEKALAQYFDKLYENRDSKFANGRTVRNIFEKSLPRQSNRLKKHLDAGEDIRERINELLLEDIIPK